MKNFKKVLALVLVVATLLSFATVASAATSASYTDADKVTRTAAVDVLSYIGVLNGYTDKTFRPQGEITRAEAAKIIAMFDNGSSAINGLYASANPFTDCVGHWAESSIAYCYKMGIIDGVGNLKFDPESNVTGVQFLKMALIVLGYNAQKEGLTGASWAVNTLSLAKKAGLLAGLGYSYDYAANLVREDAAQIMLNALNSNIVDYGYEVKNAWAGTMDTAQYITAAGAVVVKDKYLKGQWGISEVYYEDAFMRPGTAYVCNGKTIATYTLPTEKVYTTKISQCQLLEDLGIAKSDIKTVLGFEAYRNGGNKATYSLQHDYENVCRKTALLNTHQGTLTEVYDVSNWNKSTVPYRVVSIDTWLANVDTVTSTTHNRVGHRDGTTPLVTLSVYNPEDQADNKNEHNCEGGATLLSEKWSVAVEGFSKNDKVLVNYSVKTNAVEAIELAKFENAQLTGFDHTDDCDSRVVGIAGATKNEAWKFEMGYNLLTKNNVGTAKAFYYDAYGNVIGMGAPVVDVVTNYAVVDSTYYTIEGGAGVAYGTMVGLDAQPTDVKVAAIQKIKNNVFVGDFINSNVVVEAGEFSRYAYNTEYNRDHALEGTGNEWAYDVLYTWTVSNDVYSYVYAGGDYNYGDTATIEAGDKNIHVGDSYDKALNSDTVVLIHENDLSYTATTVAAVGTISATISQVLDVNDDGYADIIYLAGTIIRGGDVLTGYVADVSNTQIEWVNGKAYYVYNVYFDGVATQVRFAAEQNFGSTGLYTFSFIAGEDKIVLANGVEATASTTAVFKSFNKDYTGMLVEGSTEALNLADGLKIYYIDGNTVACTRFDVISAGTYETLWADDNITYTVNGAGQVTAIYITEDVAK